MIARHGYITLDHRGRITMDPLRHETDEGIVSLLNDGYMNIFPGNVFNGIGISPELMESLPPRTNHDRSLRVNETLATHSLGYLLIAAVRMRSMFLYNISPRFVDRLGHEVLSVCLFNFHGGLWESHVAVTSQGIFVFGKDAFGHSRHDSPLAEDMFISMDDPIIGYKVTANTTSQELHDALTHCIVCKDVFDDRVPFVRRVTALSDVIIRTMD